MSQFPSTILKPFETEFGDIRKDLRRKDQTVHEELSLASKSAQKEEMRLQEVERSENSKYRSLQSAFWSKTAQELEAAAVWRTKLATANFLDACSTYNHQATWKQVRKEGTTSWFKTHSEYQVSGIPFDVIKSVFC